jgi:hypothetical protein
MKKASAKRRPGPPARERVAIIFRVSPEVSAWLDQVADQKVLSKSAVVEKVMGVLHDASNPTNPGDPFFESYAHYVGACLIDSGVVPDEAVEDLKERNRQMREFYEADRRERLAAGKSKGAKS